MTPEKPTRYEIDNVDLKILETLIQDAKRPYTEVARKAHVSQGTVHFRMNKMQEAGIVEKTTLRINYAKLGFDITAFIGIYLEKSALYESVLEKLKGIPEITNIHYTTGNCGFAAPCTTAKKKILHLARRNYILKYSFKIWRQNTISYCFWTILFNP
jgi:DNA-binding Lrp family transcriptional regulator